MPSAVANSAAFVLSVKRFIFPSGFGGGGDIDCRPGDVVDWSRRGGVGRLDTLVLRETAVSPSFCNSLSLLTAWLRPLLAAWRGLGNV